MKKTRKINKNLGLLFTLVMAISLFVTNIVSAATTFSDLERVPWASEEITYLHEKEVVNGLPNGTFGVSTNIKRADAALMLVRAKNLDTSRVPNNSSFPDVDEGAYYYEAVVAAVEAKYFTGFPDGSFRPNAPLTREQMAKIVAEAFDYKLEDTNYFTDISSSWARSNINGIAKNGITVGSGDGKFNPKKEISRAEFSVMLARAMNDDFKQSVPDPLKEMSVHFLDVGQGDSTLIETPNGKVILIDGGLKSAGDKIVSYLAKAGITSIDLLVATHPDADHIGGLITVLEEVEVKRVLDSGKAHTTNTYFEYLMLIDEKNIPFEKAEVGSIINLDKDIKIQVLNGINSSSNLNESSIVLKVSHGNVDVLLTGDATTRNETAMIQRFNVSADILKAGHHGSNTSTSQAFINAVNPDAAILSYGVNNYGHPHVDVVESLRNSSVKLYSTYESGDIVVTSNGLTYSIKATEWTGHGEGQSSSGGNDNTVPQKPEPTPEPQFPINVNTANYATLQKIPGVGEKIAQYIIDYRNTSGPFKTIGELINVRQIGPATLEKMRPYVTL